MPRWARAWSTRLQWEGLTGPQSVSPAAVMIDADGARRSKDADVLEHVGHLGGCLRYPVELSPLTPEEFNPMKNAMVVTPSLDAVDAGGLQVMEIRNYAIRSEVRPHVLAHFRREMRIATERVSAADQPGDEHVRTREADLWNPCSHPFRHLSSGDSVSCSWHPAAHTCRLYRSVSPKQAARPLPRSCHELSRVEAMNLCAYGGRPHLYARWRRATLANSPLTFRDIFTAVAGFVSFVVALFKVRWRRQGLISHFAAAH